VEGERGTGREEGGEVGENTIGGKPTEVTQMNFAKLVRRGRRVQIGSLWPMPVTP